MSLAHFSIGTTTERISLIDPRGFHCGDWEPQAGGTDTTFSESALADYRQPIHYREITTIETIPLVLHKLSQDATIRATQQLRRLLRKAMDYFASAHQSEPVYLAAQASCETNVRYAVVLTGTLPADDNPFRQPFVSFSVMDNLTLVVERGPWTDTTPGTGTCIPACGYQEYCPIYYLEFDGDPDYVDIGSPAALDNLPSGVAGFTAEAWIRWDDTGSGGISHIMYKRNPATGTNGWRFSVSATNGLSANIQCATVDATSTSGLDDMPLEDGRWHHVLMTYDDGGDRKIYLAIDGIWCPDYDTQVAGQGAYQSDAADDLYISWYTTQYTFYGGIGWTMLHNGQPYTPGTDFVPEARCAIPPLVGTTVGGWIWEGEGTTAYDFQAANNGTIVGAEWDCACEQVRGRACVESDVHYLALQQADYVNAWSAAILDDRPLGNFTVDFWARTRGNGGEIISKSDNIGGSGWMVYEVPAGDLIFFLYYDIDHAYCSIPAQYWQDGQWHHVACIYAGGIHTPRVWCDGIERTATQQIGNANYQVDAALDLVFGANSADPTTEQWDGALGWVRIYLGARWAANFTPPDRCVIPEEEVGDAGLWIYEGQGATTGDRFGNSADASILGSTWIWDSDCDETETSCESPVYIANKRNEAQLTHIWYYDASGPTWSGNLLEETPPYDLLPAIPAAGDIVYFGIQTAFAGTTVPNSGPFCSLVFDLIPGQGELTTSVWEYYDGVTPWNTLTVQDNTNDDGTMTGAVFDTEGVKSVHWVPPADWVTANLIGPVLITGYWVRLRITGVNVPSSPEQINRHVYTITWPFVEVQDDAVLGDIAAWARWKFRNESDNSFGTADPTLYSNRLIMGLRSLDRGEDFTAYINWADEQNPADMTVGLGTGAFANNIEAPSGRCITVTPGVAEAQVCYVQVDHPLIRDYSGVFHAYVRASTAAPADYDQLGLRLRVNSVGQPDGADIYMSDLLYFANNNDWQIFDFGRLMLPAKVAGAYTQHIKFDIYAIGTNVVGDTIDLYDLILIPVDEWALDTIAGIEDFYAANANGYRTTIASAFLDVDAISEPKEWATLLKYWTTSYIISQWRRIPSHRPILQDNTTQRLWVLSTRYADATFEQRSEPCVAHSVNLYNQAHYLSMRGNR